MVSLYWGGAMVGRFAGAFILRRLKPGVVLTLCALGAAALAAVAATSSGAQAGYSLLAVGLCNSVMFPTIFAIAIERLGKDAPRGSGVLCFAIVGGAIIPVLVGHVADHVGLSLSLLVPSSGYLLIGIYGVYCALDRNDSGP